MILSVAGALQVTEQPAAGHDIPGEFTNPMATTKSRLFDTTSTSRPRSVKGWSTLLNQSLADISDLSSQVHVAHWNVKGKDFYQLHTLFDEIYGELGEVDRQDRRAAHHPRRLRARHRP